jgi:hypothetical protein
MDRVKFVCRGFANSEYGGNILTVLMVLSICACIVGLSFALGITVSVARDKWDVPANATYSDGCNQQNIAMCFAYGMTYVVCTIAIVGIIVCVVYGVVKCVKLARSYRKPVTEADA